MKKSKERQEVELDKDICTRWRNRGIAFEKELKELEQEENKLEAEPTADLTIQQEQDAGIMREEEYKEEAKKSIDLKTTLFLPSTSVPARSHETSLEI